MTDYRADGAGCAAGTASVSAVDGAGCADNAAAGTADGADAAGGVSAADAAGGANTDANVGATGPTRVKRQKEDTDMPATHTDGRANGHAGAYASNRAGGRNDDEMRPVAFTRDYLKSPFGSCLVEFGDTKVLCAASIEESVPSWLKGSGKGWVTSEYAMLPASGSKRSRRETNGQKGRTHEIQRLIGRSLRSVINLDILGEITITIDCDVIQADGGTRTASICGGWLALYDALAAWTRAGRIRANPVFGQVAAVSVGMVDGRILLDLDYREDSRAEIDMNLVMNADGEFIEVQGTGERATFDRARLDELLDKGTGGLRTLLAAQRAALGQV